MTDTTGQGRGTVAARLRRARERRFVGRAGELELFRAALDTPEPPFTVLWVHGPGGVGKSALLRAFADSAADAGATATLLDLRDVEPSPSGFTTALGEPGRVLLLDTWESAAPLDGWLRERFLPALPADSVVVVAGRVPPSPGWRADAGWRDLLRVVSLRNLRPDDSRTYLHAAGVSERHHDRALSVTHGHPLALSLVADVMEQNGETFEPEHAPDVVKVLLERFIESIPTGRHRQALEVCAHTRLTTEALLREALGLDRDEAAGLFEWLRGRSFVQQGPYGLFPHDLARDALDADLRWRDRDAYRELHLGIRGHVVRRIRTTTGQEQQRAVLDLMFLHRTNPVAQPYWEWSTLGQITADTAGPGDRDEIVQLVELHEGPASAALAEHWLDRQPEGFTVFRGGRGEVLGFLAIISLTGAAPADVEADPGTRSVWAWAQRHGPPRPGEEVTQLRFLVAKDAYQRTSPATNLVSVQCVRHWVGTERLAWNFLSVAEPEYWAPLYAYIDYELAEGAGFEVGGRTYTSFTHDWRQRPLEPWLDLMAERELDADFQPPVQPERAAPQVALSQPEFEAAVRRALHDLHRPELLARSPLTRSRLASDAAGLRARLEAAVAALGEDPRADKLLRALDRTYLRPAPTQERAAELLGLPFSTYRRHLTAGLARVSAALWEAELYGRPAGGEQEPGSDRSGD